MKNQTHYNWLYLSILNTKYKNMVRFKNIVYQKLMNFIYNGLVHGDFNEFNILLTINNNNIVVIDFPQMISIEHKEAEIILKKMLNM